MKSRDREKTMNFEIHFYEGVLKRSPKFKEAMIALADLYTSNGEYDKGLNIDEKLSQILPDDPVILYNLACSYSLINDLDKAYRTIKKAVSRGYDDILHLNRDSDLDNLRKDLRFRRYLTRLLKKSGHRQPELFYEI